MKRVGPWDVERVEGGTFALDGGAMFGIVPRTQWQQTFPPDELGRVTLAARSLLLRHDDGRVVLIDAGMGERWLGRARSSYALDEGGGLLAQLSRLGIEPADVTDVVMTHLHFDHAGGLVRKEEGRGLVPTFPTARVHVQRQHLEWARKPSLGTAPLSAPPTSCPSSSRGSWWSMTAPARSSSISTSCSHTATRRRCTCR